MMSHRCLCAFACGLLVVIANSGCSHLMEARTIAKFSEALSSENFEGLVAVSSTEFESKALRKKQAIKEFKLLKFPKGKTSIDDVEEVSPASKIVTVSIAGSKKKLKYHLIKETKTNNWVVNDIMIHRQKDGEAVIASVMKQMNLLLSVREFSAAWSGDNPLEIKEVLSPKFQQEMAGLSTSSVLYLTQQAMGKKKRTFNSKPVAEINDDTAIVRLPRQTGELTLFYKKVHEHWKVDNISLNTGDDNSSVESFRLMAKVLKNATGFVQAFRASNHKQLQALSTNKFYEGSLIIADLPQVKIPSLQNKENQMSIKLFGKQAEFIIENKKQVFTISLALTKESVGKRMTTKFRVEDIVIYDLATEEEKRISALFMSHAIIEFFADSIASRDVDSLAKTSTIDFNERVWSQLTDKAMELYPIDEIGNKKTKFLSTKFLGARTEVTVLQGDRQLVYILQDHKGELRVDDILLSVTGRPKSFKTTMELMMPVRQFTEAIKRRRVDIVQRISSKDFNRLIWGQLQGMPVMATFAPDYLNGAIRSIQVGDEVSTLIFGNENHGAKVTIVKERGYHVIDNVELISGTSPDQHALLKQTMQKRMGEGKLAIAEKIPLRHSSVKPAVYHKSAKRTETMSEDELLRELRQENGTASQQTFYEKRVPSVPHSKISRSDVRAGNIMITPNGKTVHGNRLSSPRRHENIPGGSELFPVHPKRQSDHSLSLPPL